MDREPRLHVYMLHAPDFLGYPGAIELAKDEPEIVKRGLAMKKAGNEIRATVGGREIPPVNVKVDGYEPADPPPVAIPPKAYSSSSSP